MPIRNKLKLLYVMRLMKCSAIMLAMIALVSCSNSKTDYQSDDLTSVYGDLVAYENSDLNTIEQAMPVIMILPSDKILQDFGCLKTKVEGDNELILRNYDKIMVSDGDIRPILSAIQGAFVEYNFPLSDFEQALKQIKAQGAIDKASGYAKDAKTLLLSTLRPDIIVELSYEKQKNDFIMSHKYGTQNKTYNYTLTAYDAYTNKVIATISQHDLLGTSKVDAIKKSLETELTVFKKGLMKYFAYIVTRGREVTVRVVVDKGSTVKLSDESIEGDTYTDWIIDYMKSHTVKGAYKLQMNTKNELFFTNCRIKYFNEDGTQYGVYEWTRDLLKNLRKNLGLKCSNQTQGLGDVVLTIEGFR